MDGSYRNRGPRGPVDPHTKVEEGPWAKWFSRLVGTCASLIIVSLTIWALVAIWGKIT